MTSVLYGFIRALTGLVRYREHGCSILRKRVLANKCDPVGQYYLWSYTSTYKFYSNSPKSLIPVSKYTQGAAVLPATVRWQCIRTFVSDCTKVRSVFSPMRDRFYRSRGTGMIFLVNVMLFPSNSILWHPLPSPSSGYATFHNISSHNTPSPSPSSCHQEYLTADVAEY